MPFRNDLVGGEELIRSAIRSENFDPESVDQQVSGWRIARDGSATFNNLTIGSSNFTIDASGDAVFQSVSANEIFLDGDSLADILNSRGRGVVHIYRITGTTTVGSGQTLFARVNVPAVEERLYEVQFTNLRLVKSGGPTLFQIRGFYDFDTDATNSSTPFLYYAGGQRYTSSNASDAFNPSGVFQIDSADVGKDVSLAFYHESSNGDVGFDPGSTVVSYILITDLGAGKTIIDVSAGDAGGGGGTTQVTKWYFATWSASWYGFGKRSGTRLYQGNHLLGDGTGDQYGKIGFDDAQIRSDLSGATIDSIELRMQNEHSWFNSGLIGRFGTHNNASEPGGSSSTSGSFNRVQADYNKGQRKYITLPNAIGEEFRDNTTKGITTGRTNAGNRDDYGYWYGWNATSDQAPVLRITYTK